MPSVRMYRFTRVQPKKHNNSLPDQRIRYQPIGFRCLLSMVLFLLLYHDQDSVAL
jgi:hypothetical protein